MRKNRWKQWMAGFLALAMLVTETPIVHAEEGVVSQTQEGVETVSEQSESDRDDHIYVGCEIISQPTETTIEQGGTYRPDGLVVDLIADNGYRKTLTYGTDEWDEYVTRLSYYDGMGMEIYYPKFAWYGSAVMYVEFKNYADPDPDSMVYYETLEVEIPFTVLPFAECNPGQEYTLEAGEPFYFNYTIAEHTNLAFDFTNADSYSVFFSSYALRYERCELTENTVLPAGNYTFEVLADDRVNAEETTIFSFSDASVQYLEFYGEVGETYTIQPNSKTVITYFVPVTGFYQAVYDGSDDDVTLTSDWYGGLFPGNSWGLTDYCWHTYVTVNTLGENEEHHVTLAAPEYQTVGEGSHTALASSYAFLKFVPEASMVYQFYAESDNVIESFIFDKSSTEGSYEYAVGSATHLKKYMEAGETYYLVMRLTDESISEDIRFVIESEAAIQDMYLDFMDYEERFNINNGMVYEPTGIHCFISYGNGVTSQITYGTPEWAELEHDVYYTDADSNEIDVTEITEPGYYERHFALGNYSWSLPIRAVNVSELEGRIGNIYDSRNYDQEIIFELSKGYYRIFAQADVSVTLENDYETFATAGVDSIYSNWCYVEAGTYVMKVPAGGSECIISLETTEEVSEGHFNPVYGQDSDTVYVTYIPETSGIYNIYSMGERNSYGFILLDNEYLMGDENSGENLNFRFQVHLEAGTEYCIGVRVYNPDPFNADVTVLIEKERTYVSNEIITAPFVTSISENDTVYYPYGIVVELIDDGGNRYVVPYGSSEWTAFERDVWYSDTEGNQIYLSQLNLPENAIRHSELAGTTLEVPFTIEPVVTCVPEQEYTIGEMGDFYFHYKLEERAKVIFTFTNTDEVAVECFDKYGSRMDYGIHSDVLDAGDYWFAVFSFNSLNEEEDRTFSFSVVLPENAEFDGELGEKYTVQPLSNVVITYDIDTTNFYKVNYNGNESRVTMWNQEGEYWNPCLSDWIFLNPGTYTVSIDATEEIGVRELQFVAADFQTVEEGRHTVTVDNYAFLKFVPETSSYYNFYSDSEFDTFGYSFDMNDEMPWENDDDGASLNFRITRWLEEGQEYYFAARFLDNHSGEMDVVIERESGIINIDKKDYSFNQKYNLNAGGEYEPTGLTFEIFWGDGSSYNVVYGTPEWNELESDVYYTDDFGNAVSFNDIGEGIYWRNFTIGHFGYAIRFEAFLAKEVNANADAVYFVEENTQTIYKYNIPAGYYRITNPNQLIWSLTSGDYDEGVAYNVSDWLYLAEDSYKLTVDKQNNYGGEIGLLAAPVVEEGEVTAVIGYEIDTEYFKFIPAKTATYAIYSDGYDNTYGYLAEADGSWEEDDNSGENLNFRFERQLEAGKEYYIGVCFGNFVTGTMNLVIEEYHEYVSCEIVTEPTVTTIENGESEYRPEGLVVDLVASDGYRKTLTYGTDEWNRYEEDVDFWDAEYNYIYFPVYGWSGSAIRHSYIHGFSMEIPFTVAPMPEGVPEQEYVVETGTKLRFRYHIDQLSQLTFNLANAKEYTVNYYDNNGNPSGHLGTNALLKAGDYDFVVDVASKVNEEEEVIFSFSVITPETKEFYGTEGTTYTVQPNMVTTIYYTGLNTGFYKAEYDGDDSDVKFVTAKTFGPGNSWTLAGIWNDSWVVINTIGETEEHQITVVAPEYQTIEEGQHTIRHTDRMEFLKFVPGATGYYDFGAENNELMTAYLYKQSAEDWEIEFAEAELIQRRMWLSAGEEYCMAIYYNDNLDRDIDLSIEKVTGIVSWDLRDDAYNNYYFLNSTEAYRPTGLVCDLYYGDGSEKHIVYGTPEWDELESDVYYTDNYGRVVELSDLEEGYYYRYFDMAGQRQSVGFSVVIADSIQGTTGTYYTADANQVTFITYELTPGYYLEESNGRSDSLVPVSDGAVTKYDNVWRVDNAGTYRLQVENYYSEEDVSVALVSVPTANIGSQDVEAGYEFTYLTFTPEKSGIYHIYSVGDYDTYGRLSDGDASYFSDSYYDDNGNNENFYFNHRMIAGKTYLIGARFYSVANGTITLVIEKELGVEEYRLPSENYVYTIGERSDSYDPQCMPLTLLYEDGTEQTLLYDDGNWRNKESDVHFLNAAGEEVVLDWDTPCGTYVRVSDIGGCEIRIPYEVVERQELEIGDHTITVPGNERAFYTYTVTRDGMYYFMANGTAGASARAYTRDAYVGGDVFDGDLSHRGGGREPLVTGDIVSIDYFPNNQTEDAIMWYEFYRERELESITLLSPEKDWKILYRHGIVFPGLIVRLTYDDETFDDIIYGSENWYRMLSHSDNIDLGHWDDVSEEWVKGEDADEYGNALPGEYEFYVGSHDKTLTIPFTIVDSVEQLEAITIDDEISVSPDTADNIYQLVVEETGWYEVTKTVDNTWFGYALYDTNQNPINNLTGYIYWLEAGSYMFIVSDNCADQRVAWKQVKTITTDSPIDVPGRYFEYFGYTFTPEEDASYCITTSGSWDPCVEIYKEGVYLFNDDNSGDGLNCELQMTLEKGVTYLIHVLSRYGNNFDEHQLSVTKEPIYEVGDAIPVKTDADTVVKVSVDEAGYYEVAAHEKDGLNYYIVGVDSAVNGSCYFLEPGEYEVHIFAFYGSDTAEEDRYVVAKLLDRITCGEHQIDVKARQTKAFLFIPEETGVYSFYSDNPDTEDTYGYLVGTDFSYENDDKMPPDRDFFLSGTLEKGQQYVIGCRFLNLDMSGTINLHIDKQKQVERFEILEEPKKQEYMYPFAANWIDLTDLRVKKYYDDGSEEICVYGDGYWIQDNAIIKVIDSEGNDYGYSTGRRLPVGTYTCQITFGKDTHDFAFEVKEIEREVTLNERIEVEDFDSVTYYKFTVDDAQASYQLFCSGPGDYRLFDQTGDEVYFSSRLAAGEYYFSCAPYRYNEGTQHWFTIAKFDELTEIELISDYVDMNRLFEWNCVNTVERYLRIRFATKSGYTGEDGLLNFVHNFFSEIYPSKLTLTDKDGKEYSIYQKLPLGTYTLKITIENSELEASTELEVKDNFDYPLIRKGEKYGINTNPLGNRFAFHVTTDSRVNFSAYHAASFLLYDIERDQFYRFTSGATIPLRAGDYIMKVVNYAEGNAIWFEQFGSLAGVKEISGKATEIEYGTWGYSINTVSGNSWTKLMTTPVLPNTVLNTMTSFVSSNNVTSKYPGYTTTSGNNRPASGKPATSVSSNNYVSGNNVTQYVSSNNVPAGNTTSNVVSTVSGNYRKLTKGSAIYSNARVYNNYVSGNLVGSWSVSANNLSKLFSSVKPQIGFEWLFEATEEGGESKTFGFNDAIWNLYDFVTRLFFNEDGTPAKTDANGFLAPGNYKIEVGNDDAATMIDVKVTLPENAIYVSKQPVDTKAYTGENATFAIDVLGKNLKYQWQYLGWTDTEWQTATDEGANSAVLKVSVGDDRALDGRIYRCVVTNDTAASIISDEVLLTVEEMPLTITKQPEAVTAVDGEKVAYTVEASIDDVTYQWQYSKTGTTWTNSTLTSAKTANLSFIAKETYDGRLYRCVVTKAGTKVISETATLTVKAAKPVITGQPESATVVDGKTAKFSVIATDATAYQWQFSSNDGKTWSNSTAASGKTATLSFIAKESYSGRLYRCIVTNDGGQVISDPVSLTVTAAKPVITGQPANATVVDGKTAKFTVTATGATAYQWQFSADDGKTWSNSAANSGKTATLSFIAKETYDGRLYRCIVTNEGGQIISDAVSLTVTPALPAITGQPANATVLDGKTVKFSVTATNAIFYQWQFSSNGGKTWSNSTATSGKTATLSFIAKESYNGRLYRCIVTNESGQTITDSASLTVQVAKPVITGQPANATVLDGKTVKFSVTATGATSYQWQFSKDNGATWSNSTATSGKTATLSFIAKESYSGRLYRCVVTNENGSTNSDTAVLTVTAAKPVITMQPFVNVAAVVGENAEFSVKATGDDLMYQWQVSKDDGVTWSNSTVASAKTATLSFAAKESFSGRMYRCVVTNAGGQTISETSKLFVIASMPMIETQPADVTVAAGKTAKFSVIATGEDLTYQWQYSKDGKTWTNSTATSAKTATLSFAAKDTYSGRKYRCVISNNDIVSVYTQEVTLTVK